MSVDELIASLDKMKIAMNRASGALADAGSVPTDDLEAGIRALTAQRDQLAVYVTKLKEERKRIALQVAAERRSIWQDMEPID